eukprot:5612432-Amphidinium_carterae.1
MSHALGKGGTWVKNGTLTLSPKLANVRGPLQPRIAGHILVDGKRELVSSLGGPLPHPKSTREGMPAVFDARGPAGHLREVTCQELWSLWGREHQTYEALRTSVESKQVDEWGIQGTGIQVCQALLFWSQNRIERVGACHDADDDAITEAMAQWTSAWKRGQYPEAPGAVDTVELHDPDSESRRCAGRYRGSCTSGATKAAKQRAQALVNPNAPDQEAVDIQDE